MYEIQIFNSGIDVCKGNKIFSLSKEDLSKQLVKNCVLKFMRQATKIEYISDKVLVGNKNKNKEVKKLLGKYKKIDYSGNDSASIFVLLVKEDHLLIRAEDNQNISIKEGYDFLAVYERDHLSLKTIKLLQSFY